MKKLIGLFALALVSSNSFAASKVLTFQEAADLVATITLKNELTCDSAQIPVGASFVLKQFTFTPVATESMILGDALGQYFENATSAAVDTGTYVDYGVDAVSFTAKDGIAYTNQMVMHDAVNDVYQVTATTYYDATVINAAKFAVDADGKVGDTVEFIQGNAGEVFAKVENTFEINAADNSIVKMNVVITSVDLVNAQTIAFTSLACQ